MVCTYVARDHYDPLMPPILIDGSETESYVGAALHNRNVIEKVAERNNERGSKNASESTENFSAVDSRSNKVLKRLGSAINSKSMHICLATDIDVDTLKTQDHLWNPKSHFEELLLCSITLHNNGLIETTPAFSKILVEDGSSTAITQGNTTAM